MSRVMCPVSHVTCHDSPWEPKLVELVGEEGLLSTGPTPSSFKRPGVAGAALQTALSLIHQLINFLSHPFPPNL